MGHISFQYLKVSFLLGQREGKEINTTSFSFIYSSSLFWSFSGRVFKKEEKEKELEEVASEVLILRGLKGDKNTSSFTSINYER